MTSALEEGPPKEQTKEKKLAYFLCATREGSGRGSKNLNVGVPKFLMLGGRYTCMLPFVRIRRLCVRCAPCMHDDDCLERLGTSGTPKFFLIHLFGGNLE